MRISLHRYKRPGMNINKSTFVILSVFLFGKNAVWFYECLSLIGVSTVSFRHHLPNGPLTRYVKLRVAHAPEMPGTFSPLQTSNETMHVGIAHPLWRGKHSRRMGNPPLNVSVKRPIQMWHSSSEEYLINIKQLRKHRNGNLWCDLPQTTVDYLQSAILYSALLDKCSISLNNFE